MRKLMNRCPEPGCGFWGVVESLVWDHLCSAHDLCEDDVVLVEPIPSELL
jgi:hypothetical protein